MYFYTGTESHNDKFDEKYISDKKMSMSTYPEKVKITQLCFGQFGKNKYFSGKTHKSFSDLDELDLAMFLVYYYVQKSFTTDQQDTVHKQHMVQCTFAKPYK